MPLSTIFQLYVYHKDATMYNEMLIMIQKIPNVKFLDKLFFLVISITLTCQKSLLHGHLFKNYDIPVHIMD
jgi:hypothetical protein